MTQLPSTPARQGPGRVLVVGGTGLIGSRVVRSLLDTGIPVTTLSRRAHPLGARLPRALRMVLGDARDPTVLAEALIGVEQVVYALSGGVPQVPSATPFSDVRLALEPLLSVLVAMRGSSARRLFFFSSGGAVYGNPTSLPVAEDYPTAPVSAYGVLKLAAEKYIAMYCDLYDLGYCILRAGNVYGYGQTLVPGHGAVATLLRAAATGQTLHVYGDGRGLRDYVFVEDVGHVVSRLIHFPELPPVLNVGTGQGTSVRQLLTIVRLVTGVRVRVKQRPGRRFDVTSIVLDPQRLQALCGWSPTPLQSGVAATWSRLVACGGVARDPGARSRSS